MGGGSLFWLQREDKDRPHKVGPYQEQVWKNREQEGERSWKEEICEHQGLCRRPRRNSASRASSQSRRGRHSTKRQRNCTASERAELAALTKDKLLRSWSFMVQQGPFFHIVWM